MPGLANASQRDCISSARNGPRVVGAPAAVVARLNAEINKALQNPQVAQQLDGEGAVPVPGSPQAFGDLIVREIPRWAKVVKAGNVRAD